MHRKYGTRGLRVIGIAPLTGGPNGLHAFIRRHGLTYPTLVDAGEKVVRSYGVREYPTLVLIDGSRRVRWIRNGYRAGVEQQAEDHVKQLLNPRARKR